MNNGKRSINTGRSCPVGGREKELAVSSEGAASAGGRLVAAASANHQDKS